MPGMLPSHPSPASAATATPPPSPNNIQGHHDLETVLPCSTNSSGDAETSTEFGASTPSHASRRRGHTHHANSSRLHRPILTYINLACHTAVGGGDFANNSEFIGNNGHGEGNAAQAHRVDGDAHVTIDVATLQQTAAPVREPTESATNRELNSVLSSYFRCIDGGPTRYIFTVRGTDNVGEPNKVSHCAGKYAKVLLSLFGVCLSACSAAFPVMKQGAPDGYVVLAYGLLVVLALVLLTGLLATSFDKSPSSVVWAKYALQLALGLTIGLLTWSVCSLSPTREFSVPIGVAGALVYISVVILFRRRKW